MLQYEEVVWLVLQKQYRLRVNAETLTKCELKLVIKHVGSVNEKQFRLLGMRDRCHWLGCCVLTRTKHSIVRMLHVEEKWTNTAE